VGKNVRIFDQMDALDEVVFYPVMTDDKISNYMIAGRAEEAKAVIMGIYTENFRDNAKMLSLEAVALVKYRVTKAVTSVAEKQGVSIHADTKKILTEKSVSKYFAALTDMVDLIVKEIMTKKSNAQNILAVKVREYIQQHYMDCGLSVKQIANSLHFHENYISNLYKEEYGENLSNAIEQLRIEKASELLRTTDIRIGEVAAAVGYSSDSSFRRAFKKITGVSPVDYRSSH
jgi:YesN/AraC family two-component response regulator